MTLAQDRKAALGAIDDFRRTLLALPEMPGICLIVVSHDPTQTEPVFQVWSNLNSIGRSVALRACADAIERSEAN